MRSQKTGNLSASKAAYVALQRPHIARPELVGWQLPEPVHERLPLLCRELGRAHAQLRHKLRSCTVHYNTR